VSRHARLPAPLPARVPLDDLRRILAIRLDNAGDMIMLGPALRALRSATPHASLDLLASPAGAEASAMLSIVDDVLVERAVWQSIGGQPADPTKEQAFIGRIAERAYDAAFIFTSFSQTPFVAAYACLLAGIPIRAAQAADFGGEVLTHVVPPLPNGSHQVDRNLNVVRGVGVPTADDRLRLRIPAAATTRARRLLEEVGISRGERFIVLAPGASAAARRYPMPAAIAAARTLTSEPWCPSVVLVGSAREAARLRPLEAIPGVHSLVGRTSFAELTAVIARASALLAAHSAPMHLADALGVPSVILFSGTDLASEWEPRHTSARLLSVDTWCTPCRALECPFQQECLDVPGSEVVAAVRAAVERHPDRRRRDDAGRGEEDAWIAYAS